MDRNTIIGFVLIFILVIVYSMYNQRQVEQQNEQQRIIQDSIARVEKQKRADSIRVVKYEDSLRAATAAVLEDTTAVEDSIRTIKAVQQYGPFAAAASGTDEQVTLENDKIIVTLSNIGGKITSVKVKDFESYHGGTVTLFDEGENNFGLGIPVANNFIRTDSLYYEVAESGNNSVTFRLNAGNGKYIEQTYQLEDESNWVDFNLNIVGFGDMISSRETKLALTWNTLLHRQERTFENERNNTSVYYKPMDDEVDYISETKNVSDEPLSYRLKWLAFKQQYFNSTIVAEDGFLSATVWSEAPEDTSYLKELGAKMNLPYTAAPSVAYNMRFHFGANNFNKLKKYDLEMEEMVPMGGWGLKFVNRYIILPVFNFFERFTSNYGLIILFLALFIKLVLSPLTFKSYKSQAKMKVLKPELEELKEKYKDDAQKQQMEMMKLYRKTGVSMTGGCLPLLLQMPILIAMYRFFPASIHLRQAEFLWAEDLSTYDSILSLPFTIPFYGDHVSLFTILMAITSVLYAKMNSQMTPGGGAAAAQMKMLQYIMPFFLIFIFNSMPAALTYYYLLYNVLSFGQQYVFKFFIDENKIREQIEERKKKPMKVSKWQKRLEDMQKMQQQQAAAKKKKGKK